MTDFEKNKQALIKKLVDEHISAVEMLENHKEEDCQNGKHLLYGYATGGADGHYITRCKVCPFKEEGWD